MDTLQQGVIALIHSAISGKAKTLPDMCDLAEIQELARKHQIENLIYYGAANCGVDTALPVMKELFVSTYKYMYMDQRQRQQLQKLMAAFDANEIRYLPLKGMLLKHLYPKTDMRIMGDADILIHEEQYPRIREIMQESGFVFDYETDHEIVWKISGLTLELHKKLVPERSREFYAYFGTGWDFAVQSAANPYRYEFSKETNMLFLFTHFTKHYIGSGIGIRHLVDLWVYWCSNPDLKQDYILQGLKKMSLDKFYENVMHTTRVWFEGEKPSAVSEFITSFIFANGVYGTHTNAIMAYAARDSRYHGGQKRSNTERLVRAVFPGCKELNVEYPVLKKASVLLPCIWIVRGFRILLFDRKKIHNKLQDIEKVSDENVDAYQQALNLVGLDFQPKE